MSSSKTAPPSNLEKAILDLKKQYGPGVILSLQEEQRTTLPTTSTGSLLLDKALGVGGLPHGRIVEIYGPESSGKSTLALHCIAETQKKGGTALLVDAEHAFDPEYAQNLGVDTQKLLITQPDYGEQGLEVADQLIQSTGIQLVVIDSVAALIPKSELTGEIGSSQVGAQARLMSRSLRKLTGHTHKSQTICLFINQVRQKIGTFYGNPETTPGGNALRFYASVRLDTRKEATLKAADQVIGHRIRVKVVKNKVAAPFKVASFDLIYGKGISREAELLDLGLQKGIIKQTGSWFTYQEQKLGQGRSAACQTLKEKAEWKEKIHRALTS